jgi:hypothetical protein
MDDTTIAAGGRKFLALLEHRDELLRRAIQVSERLGAIGALSGADAQAAVDKLLTDEGLHLAEPASEGAKFGTPTAIVTPPKG